MNCQNTPGCVAFNYNKVTMYCELLSQISGSTTTNPVYTTGPKMCGQSTGTKKTYVDNPTSLVVIKVALEISKIHVWGHSKNT